MSAKADIEDLKAAKVAIKKIEKKYPEAFTDFSKLLKDHRMIGYKNIARLISGSTPEDLKA